MEFRHCCRSIPRGLAAAAFAAGVALASAASLADGTRSGTFSGASGHSTSGSVTVSESGGTITIDLGGNFDLDGAPDPYVGLGVSGTYTTEITVLRSDTGAQQYTVPSGSVDLSQINEVYIWCKRYSVPLGVATLQ